MTTQAAEPRPHRPYYRPKSWARRKLAPQKEALIQQFLLLGWSVPSVGFVTGSAYKTVRALRDVLTSKPGVKLECPCGLPSNHRGSCPERLEIAQQARYIRMGLRPMPTPEPALDAPEPVKPPPASPPFWPTTKPPNVRADPTRLASDCPDGFCPMHLEHAELIGDYVIEYWMCSCNQERERRIVV